MLTVIVLSAIMSSCTKDYQDDIDKLNATHTSIEQQVNDLEAQVNTLNEQLNKLSMLSAAVEQGFYITDVKKTGDDFELKLSNGHVITLQATPDGKLTAVPAISMMQMNGLFYWTINGMLLTGTDGTPIRTFGQTPVVKYDYTLNQWLISIDGGLTFKEVNTYVSVFINDQVLMQVINSFASQYSSTLFSKQMLYQIVSTYIQQSYKELFNIEVLDEVVANYVNERYTRIFNYKLLEEIFKQYDYEYVTSNIRVEELVEVIVNFIKEHREIFEDNEVLYEIISSFLKVNQTTIFTDDILLEVINNFIREHQDYINEELLTEVITNYIDQHRDVVFNTETVKKFLMEYVKKYYVKVFSENILVQVFNIYVTRNRTTLFSETMINEIINRYVENDFHAIISEEVIANLVRDYIKKNSSTVYSRDVLVEIITNFLTTYEFNIKREDIERAIDEYVLKYKSTIIDVDLVTSLVKSYVTTYYRQLFSVDFLTQIVVKYFEENREYIVKQINPGDGIIKNIQVEGDYCIITLANSQTVRLVVYDALARLSERVQSLVIMPNANGHVQETKGYKGGFLRLNYLVAPASMSKVIQTLYYDKKVDIEFLVTDEEGNISKLGAYEPWDMGNGVLNVGASTSTYGEVKTIALHVKETKAGGTDIMSEFTVVDSEKQKGYLECPDDHHPHMINLGLSSGTLWSCCNVGAQTPEDYGGYYAWGETWTKDTYNWTSYQYGNSIGNVIDIGKDIAGTNYDVAYQKWGDSWRMPTGEQFAELCHDCTFEWTTTGSVKGYKVKGSNGGFIFIPASGGYFEWNSEINNRDYMGYYWSSIIGDYPYNATILMFTAQTHYVVSAADMGFRTNGLPVRPVAIP